MTRRDLAAAAALALQAPAQPPAPTPAAAPAANAAKEDLNASAKTQIRNAAAALDKFALPMATEPAFQFKA
jgi:hypothetical protein